MGRNRYFYIFLGLTLLALNSCTVKKRSYQKGYYVDWAFTKNHKKEAVNIPERKTEIKPETVIIQKENDPSEISVASISKINSEQLVAEKRIAINSKDTCGDVITLKNAEEIRAKVFEITDELIKYKRCDNFDGPIYTVGKEKVSHITYANGYKEIIEPPARKFQPVKNEDEKEFPSELVLACVLPLVASIIGICVSIHLANKSKKKILAHPNRYKGLALAKFVLFFDYSVIAVAIAFIILLFNLEFMGLIGIVLLAWLIALIIAAIYYHRNN